MQPSPDATPNATGFFQQYLAAPIIILLYLFWKIYTGNWKPWVRLSDIDLKTGARLLEEHEKEAVEKKTWKNLPMRIVRGLI